MVLDAELPKAHRHANDEGLDTTNWRLFEGSEVVLTYSVRTFPHR